MKLFIEVEIENEGDVDTQEIVQLLDVSFVTSNGDDDGWTASELYDFETDIVPEIKGFNIYTKIEGKLINAITGEISNV